MRDAQGWQELHGQVEAAFANGDYGQAEAPAIQAGTSGTRDFSALDPNVATSWSSLGSAQLRNNKLADSENSFRRERSGQLAAMSLSYGVSVPQRVSVW